MSRRPRRPKPEPKQPQVMPRAPMMRAIGKSLRELGRAIEALADDMAALEQQGGEPYTIDEFCERFRMSRSPPISRISYGTTSMYLASVARAAALRIARWN